MLQHFLLIALLGSAVATSLDSSKSELQAKQTAQGIINQLSQIGNLKSIFGQTMSGQQLASQLQSVHVSTFKGCNNKLPNTITDVLGNCIKHYNSISLRNYFIATLEAFTQIAITDGFTPVVNTFVKDFKTLAGNKNTFTLQSFYIILYQTHARFLEPFGYCSTLNTQQLYFLNSFYNIMHQQSG